MPLRLSFRPTPRDGVEDGGHQRQRDEPANNSDDPLLSRHRIPSLFILESYQSGRSDNPFEHLQILVRGSFQRVVGEHLGARGTPELFSQIRIAAHLFQRERQA